MNEQQLVKRLAEPTRRLFSHPLYDSPFVPQDVRDDADHLFTLTLEARDKAKDQKLFFRLMAEQDKAIWQETKGARV